MFIYIRDELRLSRQRRPSGRERALQNFRAGKPTPLGVGWIALNIYKIFNTIDYIYII